MIALDRRPLHYRLYNFVFDHLRYETRFVWSATRRHHDRRYAFSLLNRYMKLGIISSPG
jgi:hypothetical protein